MENRKFNTIELELEMERTLHQKLRRLLLEGVDRCLTPPQRRHVWLYYVDGMTVRQIAEAEGVKHPAIVRSLAAAKRNLQKFLDNLS